MAKQIFLVIVTVGINLIIGREGFSQIDEKNSNKMWAGFIPSPESEIIEKRTLSSKHFDLGNDKILAKVYTQPLHYLKENKWTDINTTIVPSQNTTPGGDTYRCETNGIKSYFKGESGEVRLNVDSIWLTFQPLGMNYEDNQRKYVINKPGEVKGTVEGNTINYEKIFGEDTLNLKVLPNKLQCELTLLSPPEILKNPLESENPLDSKGGSLECEFLITYSPDNSFWIDELPLKDDVGIKTPIVLKDKEKIGSLTLLPPYAYEKDNPKRVVKCTYTIQKIEEGKSLLKISIPYSWFLHPQRVYPVVIIFNVEDISAGMDTYIVEGVPDENNGGSACMFVGYDFEHFFQRERSLIWFDIYGLFPSWQIIDGASLRCILAPLGSTEDPQLVDVWELEGYWDKYSVKGL